MQHISIFVNLENIWTSTMTRTRKKNMEIQQIKSVMGRYIATVTRWAKFVELTITQSLAGLLTSHISLVF